MAPMADGGTWDALGRYALRLGAAAVVGFLIAKAYRVSTRRPPASLDRHATTLVLLTVLVAMTALVVDDSVARAFSLVGALAIVRFRTILEDTRDTAFVVFAVVSGMAIGVGNWILTLVGVPIVAVVALGLGFLSAGRAGFLVAQQLVVRLGGGRDPETVVGDTLRKHATSWQLKRTTTVRQGAALELTWRLEMRDDAKPTALVSELNGLEGVQHVELGEG
ncbi:MAG TPA: hypothetical protein VFG37_05765 [Planctomycetota bacterium]|jgi:hypothetical protein|nr:hypothetical protein [Planctomycetota bacterium]